MGNSWGHSPPRLGKFTDYVVQPERTTAIGWVRTIFVWPGSPFVLDTLLRAKFTGLRERKKGLLEDVLEVPSGDNAGTRLA